jgi:FKBP-type peptidyl-prolyl cis-trans isomerase
MVVNPSALLLATLLASVGAFTPLSVRQTRATRTNFQLSSSALPYNDDQMPFYALGANFALQVADLNLNQILEDDEIDVVLQAFRDNVRGQVEQPEQQKILMTYGNDLNELLAERRSRNAAGGKKEGQAFAEEFIKKNPDAKKTETGLVYLETKEGDGACPTVDSTVTVNYHGTLTDGTVVDSSVDRGEPFTFPVTGSIKGWTEGLVMMKEGGMCRLEK